MNLVVGARNVLADPYITDTDNNNIENTTIDTAVAINETIAKFTIFASDNCCGFVVVIFG